MPPFDSPVLLPTALREGEATPDIFQDLRTPAAPEAPVDIFKDLRGAPAGTATAPPDLFHDLRGAAVPQVPAAPAAPAVPATPPAPLAPPPAAPPPTPAALPTAWPQPLANPPPPPQGPAPAPILQPWAVDALGNFVSTLFSGGDPNIQVTPAPGPVDTRLFTPPAARSSAITNAPVGSTITAPTPEVIPGYNRGLFTPPVARPSAITNAPIGSTVTAPTPETARALTTLPSADVLLSPYAAGQWRGAVSQVGTAGPAAGLALIVRQQRANELIDQGAPVAADHDLMNYSYMTPEQRAQAKAQLAKALDDNLTSIVAASRYQQSLPVDPGTKEFLESKGFWPSVGNYVRSPVSNVQASMLQSAPGLALGAAGEAVGGPGLAIAAMGGVSGGASFAASLLTKMTQAGVDINDPAARQAWIAANGPEVWGDYGRHMTAGAASAALQVGPFKAAGALPIRSLPGKVAVGTGLGAGTGAAAPYVEGAITGEEVSPSAVAASALTGAAFGITGAGVGAHAPPREAPPMIIARGKGAPPETEPAPRPPPPGGGAGPEVPPAPRPEPPTAPPAVPPVPPPETTPPVVPPPDVAGPTAPAVEPIAPPVVPPVPVPPAAETPLPVPPVSAPGTLEPPPVQQPLESPPRASEPSATPPPVAAPAAVATPRQTEPPAATEPPGVVSRPGEPDTTVPPKAETPAQTEPARQSPAAEAPKPAASVGSGWVWRSADHDYPVEPTGVEQTHTDGVVYAQVRQPDGQLSYVPKHELVQTAAEAPKPAAPGEAQPAPARSQTSGAGREGEAPGASATTPGAEPPHPPASVVEPRATEPLPRPTVEAEPAAATEPQAPRGEAKAPAAAGAASEPPAAAGTGKRPVTVAEHEILTKQLTDARREVAKLERTPGADAAQLAKARNKLDEAQAAVAQAERPPTRATFLRGGPGPSEHLTALEAHRNRVDQRAHAEGGPPEPASKKDLGGVLRMSGLDATHTVITRGTDSAGHAWAGTGNTLLRGNIMEPAIASLGKLKTPPQQRTVPSPAITKVVTPPAKTHAVDWLRQVTTPITDKGGRAWQVVAGRADNGRYVGLQRSAWAALTHAAGEGGRIEAAPDGSTFYARDAKGDVVGVASGLRSQGQAETWATGKLPGEKPSETRAETSRAETKPRASEAPKPEVEAPKAEASPKSPPSAEAPAGPKPDTSTTSGRVRRMQEINDEISGLARQSNALKGQLTKARNAGLDAPKGVTERRAALEARIQELEREYKGLGDANMASTAPSAEAQDAPSAPRQAQTATQPLGTPEFTREAVASDISHRQRQAFAEIFRGQGETAEQANLHADAAMNYPPARKAQMLAQHTADKFGFGEVRVDPRDTQTAVEHLADLNHDMHAMAFSLGIPLRMIGRDMNLVLSRNRGEGAYGSYNARTHDLTLYGRSRSFAHEWWHAQDARLSQALSRSDFQGWMASRGFSPMFSRGEFVGGIGGMANLHTDTAGRFGDLLTTLFTGNDTMARQLQAIRERASTRPEFTTSPDNTQAGLDLARAIAQNPSEFFRRSEAFGQRQGGAEGGAYFRDPAEMLARSGEAYTAHKIQEANLPEGIVSKRDAGYLSTGDARFRDTFPKGEERTAIFNAYDNLIHAMQADHVMGDGRPGTAPLAQRPHSGMDMLAPDLWHRLAPPTPETQGVRGALRRVASNAMQDVTSIRDALRPGGGEVLADRAGLAPLSREAQAGVARASAAAPGLMQNRFIRGAVGRTVNLGSGVRDTWNATARSIGGRLGVQVAKYRGRGNHAVADILQGVRNQWDPQIGSRRFIGDTYGAAINRETRSRVSAIANILDQHGLADVQRSTASITGGMRRAEAQRLKDQLRLAITGHAAPGTPERVTRAAAAIRDQLDSLWHYANNAGLDVGHASEPYFPRVLVNHLVFDNEPRFIRQATLTYADQFDERLAQSRADNPTYSDARHYDGVLRGEGIQGDHRGDEARARALYSEQRAQEWNNRLRSGVPENFKTLGPDAGFRNERVLPASADRHMAEFYVRDPMDALTQHVRQAVQRAEYVRRVGPNNEHFQGAMERAVAAGLHPDDKAEMAHLVEMIAGRSRSWYDTKSLRNGLNAAHAYGTLALMPRAVFASLAEPMMLAVQSRSMAVTLQGFRSLVNGLTNGADYHRQKELAHAWGVTTSAMHEQIMSDRYLNGMHDDSRYGQMLNNFYQRTGLTQLTNFQRQAMIAPAELHIRNQLRDALDGSGFQQNAARGELRELGIHDRDMAPLRDWLNEHQQLDTATVVGSDHGDRLGAAIGKFIDRVIADPQRVDRPEMAHNPLGRFMYGLMSFNFALQRNLHARIYEQIKALHNEGGGAMAQARNLASYGIPLAALFGANMASSTLRNALFGAPQRPGDNPDPADLFGMSQSKWLALSRSGAFGAFDPLVSAFRGMRYHRDLSSMVEGPYAGFFLQALQNILMPSIGANSEVTNSAERNRAKGIHAMLSPVLMKAITSLPGGWPTAAFGMWATGQSAQSHFADLLAGPARGKGGGGMPQLPKLPKPPSLPTLPH